jgi:hypothetical protein
LSRPGRSWRTLASTRRATWKSWMTSMLNRARLLVDTPGAIND